MRLQDQINKEGIKLAAYSIRQKFSQREHSYHSNPEGGKIFSSHACKQEFHCGKSKLTNPNG